MLIRIYLAMEPGEQRDRLESLLQSRDVLRTLIKPGQSFWDPLATENVDLVVASMNLLPPPPGESIASIGNLPEQPALILVAGENGMGAEERAAHLTAGCLAVLYPRIGDDALGDQIDTLLGRVRESALQRLKAEQAVQYRLGDFVTASPSMGRLMSIARRVADSDTSLLILGETGVGKEWLAKAIHEEGPRGAGPLIPVNLGAIPESLIESALFGHEEGAFTGATRSHRGYFELAHHGTVFLDEIAEMPTHLQVKLLRVLQEKKIQRVGGESVIDVDVRIIAATNLNLEEEIRAKRFRRDLYYRIGVVSLKIPPLRERREDIVDLAENYLSIYRTQLKRPITGIDPQAIDLLIKYRWPGNVRELMNVVERAVLLSTNTTLGTADLPDTISGRGPGFAMPAGAQETEPGTGTDDSQKTLHQVREETVSAVEQAYLKMLLAKTEGRIGVTARRAGITSRTLYERMQRYGLRKEDYKP